MVSSYYIDISFSNRQRNLPHAARDTGRRSNAQHLPNSPPSPLVNSIPRAHTAGDILPHAVRHWKFLRGCKETWTQGLALHKEEVALKLIVNAWMERFPPMSQYLADGDVDEQCIIREQLETASTSLLVCRYR